MNKGKHSLSTTWRRAAYLITLLLALQLPGAVLACATCGCSELCAVTMLDDATRDATRQSLLSNSIWGNMILKMAYERDPELQRLKRMTKGVNFSTASTLAAAAAGTLPQVSTSLVTLNPPSGTADSYAPGIIGVALAGASNVALWVRWGFNAGLLKKMRARQMVIRQQVEATLRHLECSETNCSEARKQLSSIIGDLAAGECIDLWQTGHAVASVPAAGS